MKEYDNISLLLIKKEIKELWGKRPIYKLMEYIIKNIKFIKRDTKKDFIYALQGALNRMLDKKSKKLAFVNVDLETALFVYQDSKFKSDLISLDDVAYSVSKSICKDYIFVHLQKLFSIQSGRS